MHNLEDLKRTWGLLNHTQQTELRFIKKGKIPVIKFVNNITHFFNEVKKRAGLYNCYVGVNERKHNGTKNKDVIKRNFFLLDIDPVRPSGIASTDEELCKSFEVTNNICKYFSQQGYDKPSVAMSGNGHQIWCNVDLPVVNGVEPKAKYFEDFIRNKFQTPEVSIDNISDVARIMKVIGTQSIKGEDTHKRPHRISKWVSYNQNHIIDKKLTSELLQIRKNVSPKKSISKIEPFKFTKKNIINQKYLSSSSKGHSKIFDLQASDLFSSTRAPHPTHGSSNGNNFSLSDQGLLHCWRHKVSMNAIQFLALLSGLDCSEVATPHNGTCSTNYDELIFLAWREAKLRKIIPAKDPIPTRAILHIAKKHKLVNPSYEGFLNPEIYNNCLKIVQEEY